MQKINWKVDGIGGKGSDIVKNKDYGGRSDLCGINMNEKKIAFINAWKPRVRLNIF